MAAPGLISGVSVDADAFGRVVLCAVAILALQNKSTRKAATTPVAKNHFLSFDRITEASSVKYA